MILDHDRILEIHAQVGRDEPTHEAQPNAVGVSVEHVAGLDLTANPSDQLLSDLAATSSAAFRSNAGLRDEAVCDEHTVRQAAIFSRTCGQSRRRVHRACNPAASGCRHSYARNHCSEWAPCRKARANCWLAARSRS
jgi:hypothetical protein